jgi:hypothetical protein
VRAPEPRDLPAHGRLLSALARIKHLPRLRPSRIETAYSQSPERNTCPAVSSPGARI